MTKAQQQHIENIIHEFSLMAEAKYDKGVKEHGGNLWDLPYSQILDNAIEEAIDQFVYLITLKMKLYGEASRE